MWTTKNRPRYDRDKLRYPSDLTDEEWSLWGIHLTGVELRRGKWNVPMPVPTTPGLLGSFKLGSRLMQTAWTTWNGCDGLAASSVRPVVIRVDGGLGTADSCVLDAIAAHR